MTPTTRHLAVPTSATGTFLGLPDPRTQSAPPSRPVITSASATLPGLAGAGAEPPHAGRLRTEHPSAGRPSTDRPSTDRPSADRPSRPSRPSTEQPRVGSAQETVLRESGAPRSATRSWKLDPEESAFLRREYERSGRLFVGLVIVIALFIAAILLLLIAR